MKKLFTLFAMLTLLVSLNAQTISYQAVLRDTTDGKNELVRSQSGNVSIFVNAYNPIVEANADVPNSYPVPLILESEFTTNANGMVNVLIDLSEVETDGVVDWRGNEIVAVFAYNNTDTITLVTPVTAVPYAIQADEAILTTNAIASYVGTADDLEEIWMAVKRNESLNEPMRDSIAAFLKENYDKAKEIIYSYFDQVTAADVRDAYDQAKSLNQETKDTIYSVLKDFLNTHRDLVIEMAEYYAQTATEDEMRTVYEALKTNVGPTIKELLYNYFDHYMETKGLVCPDKTLCGAVRAMEAAGGGQ